MNEKFSFSLGLFEFEFSSIISGAVTSAKIERKQQTNSGYEDNIWKIDCDYNLIP